MAIHLRSLFALFVLGASPLTAQAPPRAFRVAITVDDVPWNGPPPAPDSMLAFTRRLLGALRRHGAPVAAFVNCRGDDASRRVLDEWIRAGATIGNHVTGHRDLHATPPAEWAAAVRDCHGALRRAGVRPAYLRYPQLHEGRTPAERDTAAAVMRALGYRNATVTIDNGDYLLAAPYDAAVAAGDARARERISRLMLEHDSLATRHFREVAMEVVGRDVAHVLLLHANRMTADNMDRLLTMLRGMGAEFVSLHEALRDPVYARTDRYRGPKGLSWLYRIAPPRDGAAPIDAWDVAESLRLRRATQARAARATWTTGRSLAPPSVRHMTKAKM